MKKVLMLGMSLVLLVGTAGCFGNMGCTNPAETLENKKFKSQYFYYYWTSDSGKEKSSDLAILDLTEEGKEQETIVIPSEIDGNPVVQFGYFVPNLWMGYTNFVFESDKLKKLILPSSLTTTTDYAFSEIYPEILIYEGMGKMRWNGAQYERAYVAYNNDSERSKAVANVTFLWNYEDSPNNGVYALDHVREDEIIRTPDIPRREGYTFKGWYRDIEYSQPFDPSSDRLELAEEENTMMLYAKWE